MTSEDFVHRVHGFTFRGRVWTCCGYMWELLYSSKFPSRESDAPTCPTCNEKGKPKYQDVKCQLKILNKLIQREN